MSLYHGDGDNNNDLTARKYVIRRFFIQKLRYLKRCCGSWNSGEPFEIKDAKCCILTLLVRCLRKFGTAEILF